MEFNAGIPYSYLEKAQDGINSRNNVIKNLLYHKKIPEEPCNEKLIQDLLGELTFIKNVQKFYFSNDMVAGRNYNLLLGSSLLPYNCGGSETAKVTSKLNQLGASYITELLKIMGIQKPFNCCILPVATGMSLIFSLLTFRSLKPNANYIIWSRIDQKSCFKSIISAGFIPIIIDTKRDNEEYITDISEIEKKIEEIGVDNINCVMTTTSCFAPRACDNIEAVARICDRYDLYHLINNAYGLSNRNLMKRIHKASFKGRVDIFTQSTDKNLGVPVGGAIVVSFNQEVFTKFLEIHSESMSTNAIIDVIITFLNIGKRRFVEMIDNCQNMYQYLMNEMGKLASEYGEKVIENPGNPISIAMTLRNMPPQLLTETGSMLYKRNVSGVRIVTAQEVKTICDFTFKSWGAHSNDNTIPYLTAAASIGIRKNDIDVFIDKLDKILSKLLNKNVINTG